MLPQDGVTGATTRSRAGTEFRCVAHIGDAQRHASFPFSGAAMAFGAALTVVGLLNQAVRQPPLEISPR